jgi:hypothetical protein
MKRQLQKKVARTYRIKGSLVLNRFTSTSPFKSERPLPSVGPWWAAIVGIPLFLRTLFRLVYVCAHRHMGPPITSREVFPPNPNKYRSLVGRGTCITCLDCGQKFAYNSTTRRLADFWGVHDVEVLEGVRRRTVEFFSPLRDLAAWAGRVITRIPIAKLVRPIQLWSSNGARGSARPVTTVTHR